MLKDIFITFISQARRSDEENYRDSDGERRRDGSALVPDRVPEVRADGHTHHRVRLYAELRHELDPAAWTR